MKSDFALLQGMQLPLDKHCMNMIRRDDIPAHQTTVGLVGIKFTTCRGGGIFSGHVSLIHVSTTWPRLLNFDEVYICVYRVCVCVCVCVCVRV